MPQQLSILNVGGHPKDAILYAGGTLAVPVANGDRVCNLTPYHGLSHHERAIDEYKNGHKPDMGALFEERKREFIEANHELGVTDVRFLGYDDEVTLPKEEIINDIADVIGDVRPDIVITHWPNDSVPAHASATQMVFHALWAAMGMRATTAAPYAPHSVKQVFMHVAYGAAVVQENSRPHVPTTVIDITDVIRKKSNAMNRFKSQYFGEDSLLWRKESEMMDGSHHAIAAGIPYAEAFIMHQPEVYKLLPLSEYRLELSSRSTVERIRHGSQMLLGG